MSFQANDFANTAKWEQYVSVGGVVDNISANSFRVTHGAIGGETAGLATVSLQNTTEFDISIMVTNNSAYAALLVTTDKNRGVNSQVGMARDRAYGIRCLYGGGGPLFADPIAPNIPAELRITRSGGIITWYYNGTQIYAQAEDIGVVVDNMYVMLFTQNTLASGQIISGADVYSAQGGGLTPTTLSFGCNPNHGIVPWTSQVSGVLLDNLGVGVPNAQIAIETTLDGGVTWVSTGVTAVTDALSGAYTALISFLAADGWVAGVSQPFRATFAGDATYNASASASVVVTMDATPQYTLTVNSQPSGITFTLT